MKWAGLGAWPLIFPRYALYDDGTFVNQAHNEWAQWAEEGGVPLLLLMFALAIVTVPRAIGSVWGISVIAVWLHALVDYPFQQKARAGRLLFCSAGRSGGEPIG